MTLDDLLSQTDDANVKRLILDAYKLGVADDYARDRVKPNYPETVPTKATHSYTLPYNPNLRTIYEDDGA